MKKVLIGIGLLVAVIVSIPVIKYSVKYVFADSFVDVSAKYDYEGACLQSKPIWVSIKNNSSRTIKNFKISVEVEVPHHSNAMKGKGYIDDDTILEPNERAGFCLEANPMITHLETRKIVVDWVHVNYY